MLQSLDTVHTSQRWLFPPNLINSVLLQRILYFHSEDTWILAQYQILHVLWFLYTAIFQATQLQQSLVCSYYYWIFVTYFSNKTTSETWLPTPPGIRDYSPKLLQLLNPAVGPPLNQIHDSTLGGEMVDSKSSSKQSAVEQRMIFVMMVHRRRLPIKHYPPLLYLEIILGFLYEAELEKPKQFLEENKKELILNPEPDQHKVLISWPWEL